MDVHNLSANGCLVGTVTQWLHPVGISRVHVTILRYFLLCPMNAVLVVKLQRCFSGRSYTWLFKARSLGAKCCHIIPRQNKGKLRNNKMCKYLR